MPEGLEAEIWRRAAESVVGRTIASVSFDARVASENLDGALVGRSIGAVRRVGKVLIFETDGPALGVHFGMTGRLIVDGVAPIEELEYASGADRPEWDRLLLYTSGHDVPALRMNDPRRLGRLSLDPDMSSLGPDALTLSEEELRAGLAGRTAAIKTLLLNQRVVAGLGNLCADEVLFHAGINPSRPADRLSDDELGQLARSCRTQLPVMLARGGSTEGVLAPAIRAALPPCPLDGGTLLRQSLGGRTAVWCSVHQL